MKINKSLIAVLILTIFLPGCWFARGIMNNTTKAIFGKPLEIKNKIKDPIKDDVRLSALWVGHSTVLLQMDDKVVLVDPVFEDVIGGLMLRKYEAGLDIESIPRLDAVLVSHAHMDHMSITSIRDLDDRFPEAALVFPIGSEYYLPNYDMDMVRLNTGNSKKRGYIGETKTVNGIKVTAVFAQHQGGRYGLDSYSWYVPGCTGYIFEYNGLTVFYAGDTGYDDNAYKVIGDKFDIDLALIPIGPCGDCGTEGYGNHVASYGALLMFDDLKADHMIPVHYGAITYRNDPDIPLVVLEELIGKYTHNTATGMQSTKPYSERIVILDEGQQHIFEYKE
ncbi:MAG TPA: MBL fold metallo-hydrolase [Ignavibacteria bacterium]|nr:MBL fold metallo-hydrolase [Ignavibacteria bacterium]